jgi:hypothetical protein
MRCALLRRFGCLVLLLAFVQLALPLADAYALTAARVNDAPMSALCTAAGIQSADASGALSGDEGGQPMSLMHTAAHCPCCCSVAPDGTMHRPASVFEPAALPGYRPLPSGEPVLAFKRWVVLASAPPRAPPALPVR